MNRGSLVQKLYFIGLAWVSATFATSVYNLIPVITFVFSVLCGYVESSLFTITTGIYIYYFLSLLRKIITELAQLFAIIYCIQ